MFNQITEIAFRSNLLNKKLCNCLACLDFALIPYDKHHIHLDKGETEITLSLSPGKHTLQVVVGDEEHEPFEHLVSKKIVIDVISEK